MVWGVFSFLWDGTFPIAVLHFMCSAGQNLMGGLVDRFGAEGSINIEVEHSSASYPRFGFGKDSLSQF